MNAVISASFSAGGFCHNRPCVYLLAIRSGKDTWAYVGRTSSSNGSGVSAPYKRLAAHLSKRGATQSCIWDNTSRFPERTLEYASISFHAVLVDACHVRNAERWLQWQLRDKGVDVLNRPPHAGKSTPVLEAAVAKSVSRLLKHL